jgi:1,4-alpha-glucan branching enzyme
MAKGKPSKGAPKSPKKQVSLVVKAAGAREVVVVGDFNQWNEAGIRLAKSGDEEWKTTLSLEPGEYQYRLRIDGEWRDHAEAQKRVPNPYGSENCVLIVG